MLLVGGDDEAARSERRAEDADSEVQRGRGVGQERDAAAGARVDERARGNSRLLERGVESAHPVLAEEQARVGSIDAPDPLGHALVGPGQPAMVEVGFYYSPRSH